MVTKVVPIDFFEFIKKKIILGRLAVIFRSKFAPNLKFHKVGRNDLLVGSTLEIF